MANTPTPDPQPAPAEPIPLVAELLQLVDEFQADRHCKAAALETLRQAADALQALDDVDRESTRILGERNRQIEELRKDRDIARQALERQVAELKVQLDASARELAKARTVARLNR